MLGSPGRRSRTELRPPRPPLSLAIHGAELDVLQSGELLVRDSTIRALADVRAAIGSRNEERDAVTGRDSSAGRAAPVRSRLPSVPQASFGAPLEVDAEHRAPGHGGLQIRLRLRVDLVARASGAHLVVARDRRVVSLDGRAAGVGSRLLRRHVECRTNPARTSATPSATRQAEALAVLERRLRFRLGCAELDGAAVERSRTSLFQRSARRRDRPERISVRCELRRHHDVDGAD